MSTAQFVSSEMHGRCKVLTRIPDRSSLKLQSSKSVLKVCEFPLFNKLRSHGRSQIADQQWSPSCNERRKRRRIEIVGIHNCNITPDMVCGSCSNLVLCIPFEASSLRIACQKQAVLYKRKDDSIPIFPYPAVAAPASIVASEIPIARRFFLTCSTPTV